MQRAPFHAYLAAGICALLAFAAFCVLSLRFSLANDLPLVCAGALCVPTAIVFARIWPSVSWRWGLWISAGFWLFLGLVFFSFLADSGLEWRPAADAVIVVTLSCAGAWAGQRLARHTRA